MKKFRKYCNDYLELEEMTGRQSDLAPLYTNITAEKMAAQERRRLGLGDDPILDVFSLIEQNGLHVWRYPIPEEINIAGVFVFLEYKQTAFALINSYQSFSQQILTATHEYGHYLKDRFDGPIIDNHDIFIEDYITLYHGREKYAQTFALHFLLPPEGLKDFIESDLRSKQLNLEDILYIRRYHDVSFLAILQMLKKLDFVSVSQFKELQILDWEQHENSLFGPGKMNLSQRSRGHSLLSTRYVSLVLDAFRIKKISAKKAGQLLRLNKGKFLSLLKR
jgi:Zn-dependent peptidase ImmA (M78 family)